MAYSCSFNKPALGELAARSTGFAKYSEETMQLANRLISSLACAALQWTR